MKVIPVTTGALLENAYIAADEEAKEAIVIDPGDDAREIEEQLDRLGLGVAYILLTHGHADHIGAVLVGDDHQKIPFFHKSAQPALCLDSQPTDMTRHIRKTNHQIL